jgi:hypothetical protein
VPSNNLNGAIVLPLFNEDATLLILSLGYLIAPLIAAILAGKIAESKFQGFLGWLLTVIVSTTAIIIAILAENILEFTTFQTKLLDLYGWDSFELILISLVISAVVNIIFYGFFALLLSKTEYY